MADDKGIELTNIPQATVQQSEQTVDVPSSQVVNAQQRTSSSGSVASPSHLSGIKKLIDHFDPSELPSAKYERQSLSSVNVHASVQDVEDDEANLFSTERQLQRSQAVLRQVADNPHLGQAQLDAIAGDQKLLEDLVQTLRRKKTTDENPDAEKARAFMRSAADHWRSRDFRWSNEYSTHKRRDIERTFKGLKATAVKMVRLNRPQLPPAENSLQDVEDLYADVIGNDGLSPFISKSEKARLHDDLQTLKNMIAAGRENGWLPTNENSSVDRASQALMEQKICNYSSAISTHVRKMVSSKGSFADLQKLDELNGRRESQAAEAKSYLSELAQLHNQPRAPTFNIERQNIAETLVKVHPKRGREIMDSLPPDYVADLVRAGRTVKSLESGLYACRDLLHVSQSGFGDATGKLAYLKGVWNRIRNCNGRALNSWQAAQVRRTVAMLALAGASKSEIRDVRDTLIAKVRDANEKIGSANRQKVERSVDPQSWSSSRLNSLSSYKGKIERNVASSGFADRRRWLPLINLHTAMDNVSRVLESGCSTDDAIQVFKHDMDFISAARMSSVDHMVPDDGRRLSQAVLGRPDGSDSFNPLLPHIGDAPRRLAGRAPHGDKPVDVIVQHKYAHLVQEASPEELDVDGNAASAGAASSPAFGDIDDDYGAVSDIDNSDEFVSESPPPVHPESEIEMQPILTSKTRPDNDS